MVSILFEVSGTVMMRSSMGLSKLVPTILMFTFYLSSIALMSLVLKKIELNIAYAIWAGMGTLTITIVGFIYFKEEVSVEKIVCIAFILIGVVGLKLSHT